MQGGLGFKAYIAALEARNGNLRLYAKGAL